MLDFENLAAILAQTIAYIHHQVDFSGYKAVPLSSDDALARIY